MCSPKGRDCIESNFTLTFNCSVSCVGVYADVQWVYEPFEEGEELEEETENINWEQEDIGNLNKEMMLMYAKLERRMSAELERRMKLLEHKTDKKDKKRDELDKEKLWKLISEYKKFKRKNVKHFRFNENFTSNMFGKLAYVFSMCFNICQTH